MYELSILICTKNDAEVITGCLESIHQVIWQESIFTEVLVVDDSSTDGTIERAVDVSHRYPELHLRILRRSLENPGLGALVRFGMAMAEGHYCALVSADGTDPVGLLPKMIAELRSGKQLVICTRYNDSEKSPGALSEAYQRVYRRAIQLLLGERVHDSTNAFRAFERTFVQAVGLSSNKFSVCPEMAFKTLLAGGLISYVEAQPRATSREGSERFKDRHELPGYAMVLARATLHRAGVHWF